MIITKPICCRRLLVVLVLVLALATPSGPISLKGLVVSLLLVLILIVLVSLDCTPLRGDATLSNSLGTASLPVVAPPSPQAEYPAMRYPSKLLSLSALQPGTTPPRKRSGKSVERDLQRSLLRYIYL